MLPGTYHITKNGRLPYDLGAFDLDGTVLRRDLTITDTTVSALRELRERGMRLVVATGRRFEGAAQKGLHARVFTDGKIVVSPETPAALRHLANREPDVEVVESPADWLRDGGEEPTKLVIVDHPGDVSSWLDEAQRTFSGRLFVTRSLPHYVEVGVLEGTKASALAFLCEWWGIDPARTLAFGDADNDVDMLVFAGLGVVVGGMSEEVRAAADAVAPPVSKDGVASFVRGLLEEEGY